MQKSKVTKNITHVAYHIIKILPNSAVNYNVMEVQYCCCIIHKITPGWQRKPSVYIYSHRKLLTSIVSWLEASFKSPLLFCCYRNNFTCDCTINEGYHTGSEHPSYQVPTRVHSKFLLITNLDISQWHHIFLHPMNTCFPTGINW